jgi:hypothetical protein
VRWEIKLLQRRVGDGESWWSLETVLRIGWRGGLVTLGDLQLLLLDVAGR